MFSSPFKSNQKKNYDINTISDLEEKCTSTYVSVRLVETGETIKYYTSHVKNTLFYLTYKKTDFTFQKSGFPVPLNI